MEVVKILDTTIAENGPTQSIDEKFLKINVPIRFHANVAAGDTVLIQGRLSPAHDWDTLYSFTDETPKDIYPSLFMRAIRSVDGASGDSQIYIGNPFPYITLTEHTA